MMWTRNNMLSTQTRRGLTTNLSLVVLLLLGILPPLTSAFQNCHISNPIRVSGPSTILLRMVDSQTRSDSTTPQETAPPPPPRKINKSIGGWEELHGNWVLRPPISDEPPRAVLHFLGGALVGASPQITYRYMLEKLAAKGYLIIATPYQLSFDHLETCDEVISKFELMAPTIARQYGALPVVGIGHSCGALLQLLITSLFPDTPRAANALMSFNNKPVTEAIPFFEEVFAPLFTAIAAKNSTLLPSGSEAMILSLKLAKSATEGRWI
jgi:acetyl esterase/lipase